MSLTVKLSLAERFINWFPHNTKLYIRGERGKDWAGSMALYTELASQLNPFLNQLVEDEIQYRIEKGLLKINEK